jgi:hypothetical protein
MRPLYRTVLAIFCLVLFVLSVSAGSGSAKNENSGIGHLPDSIAMRVPVLAPGFQKNFPSLMRNDIITTLDSILSKFSNVVSVKKNSSGSLVEMKDISHSGMICSCQILNLESTNYDHRFVVLLAEKTSKGVPSDFTIAKNRILTEKKHLKEMFYNKVKLIAEMQGTGSCQSMYFRLKTADSKLQLYEILNADIH